MKMNLKSKKLAVTALLAVVTTITATSSLARWDREEIELIFWDENGQKVGSILTGCDGRVWSWGIRTDISTTEISPCMGN